MTWARSILTLAVCGLLLAGCIRKEAMVEPLPPTRAEIWAAIQPRATRYRMDPAFIYALVAAESNFDPKARNGSARGLMQLMPGAWKAVSSRPYEPTVWDWRANLEAGIDYLAYTRSYLQKKKVPFSYPVLLASFHYGLDHMEDRGWDAGSVAVPANAIYRELWRGNLTPVAVPR
jgi:hypothetical protein